MSETPPRLPPLNIKALDDIQTIERAFGRLLNECIGIPYNVDKATEILRTCVIAAFNARVNYYFSLDIKHPAWFDQIGTQSINSAMGMIGFEVSQEARTALRLELQRTLND